MYTENQLRQAFLAGQYSLVDAPYDTFEEWVSDIRTTKVYTESEIKHAFGIGFFEGADAAKILIDSGIDKEGSDWAESSAEDYVKELNKLPSSSNLRKKYAFSDEKASS